MLTPMSILKSSRGCRWSRCGCRQCHKSDYTVICTCWLTFWRPISRHWEAHSLSVLT